MEIEMDVGTNGVPTACVASGGTACPCSIESRLGSSVGQEVVR